MTTHTVKNSTVGLSKILPESARSLLIEAAKTKDLTKINAAIRLVREQYPIYFKNEI